MLRPSEGKLESWLANFDYQRIDYLNGGLKTEAFFLRPFTLTNRTGDSMTLALSDFTERLIEPFQIYPGIVIPVGEYDSDSRGIQAGTGNHRKVAAFTRIVEYPDGKFYGGDRSDRFLELTWRPSARFRGSLSYEYNDIDLPQGSFEVRLVRAGIDFAFSPTLSWVNLIQYDNVSEIAGINMRLHWIPEAGREVYLRHQSQRRGLRPRQQLPLVVLRRDGEGKLHLSLLTRAKTRCRSMARSSLLFLCAALISSVSSAQPGANVPADTALSVVAYVEARAAAAETARATLNRYREASRAVASSSSSRSAGRVISLSSRPGATRLRSTRAMTRRSGSCSTSSRPFA